MTIRQTQNYTKECTQAHHTNVYPHTYIHNRMHTYCTSTKSTHMHCKTWFLLTMFWKMSFGLSYWVLKWKLIICPATVVIEHCTTPSFKFSSNFRWSHAVSLALLAFLLASFEAEWSSTPAASLHGRVLHHCFRHLQFGRLLGAWLEKLKFNV